jgi:hypothetical protein
MRCAAPVRHMMRSMNTYVLPASRQGQALTSVYVNAWLDRYLKHRSIAPLLATSFRYLEPIAVGDWQPVSLDRSKLLSFYYCSGWSMRDEKRIVASSDPAAVGGC